jgi:hypothetical protein
MNYEEVKSQQEISSIKSHKKLWFLFFGIIFVAIIIFLFVIVLPDKEEKVLDKELIKGATLNLEENDSMGFEFGNEDHGIRIDFVGFDSAGITIFSDPITFVLELNEAEYIDLNKDEVYDIKVKLIKIENATATIAIKKVYLTICEENWNCSKWNECLEGNQTRVCEDLNSCGTMDNKPYELRECLKIQFVENDSFFENGTDKNANNTRIGNLTNFTNGSNLTNKTGKIINSTINAIINDTIVGPAIIDCGNSVDYSCFINASKNCTSAIWNLSSSSIASPLVHYEIKGYADDGRCIYYEKYLAQTIEKICKINKEELTSIFTEYSQGRFSTADFYNAECYPRDNFDCKLDLVEGSLQGMSLYLSSYNSISSQFSVKGYSDITKIIWIAENSSVIKLEPTIGNYSVISPIAVGETFLIINDTSVKFCELKIPFEVYGDEFDSLN